MRAEIEKMRYAFHVIACSGTLFFLAATTTVGQTTNITFDDLVPANLPGAVFNGDTYFAPIPNGYAGLQWNNFWVLDASHEVPSGYVNGLVSSPNVGFNDLGNNALFSGGTFTLNSAYLTAAWNNGLQVEVQGFVGNTLTYDNTYTVDTSGSTLIDFNYVGIDEVKIIASGGVNAGYGGRGTNVAIDDLNITFVPEPSAYVLLVVASSGFLLYRRLKPRTD